MKLVVLCASLGLATASLAAGETNLDQLQKLLDAKRAAASATAAPARPAARPAPARRDATVVVRTDAACRLAVDGRFAADLEAGVARSLTLPPGETLFECQSTFDAAVRYSSKLRLDPADKLILQVELLEKLANARRSHESGARPAAASQPTAPSRGAAAAGPSTSPQRATASPAPGATPATNAANRPASSPAIAAAPAAATTSEPPSWAHTRGELQALGRTATLARGLTVLLDAKGDDAATIADFESFARRLRWNSAVVFATRSGLLFPVVISGRNRLDFAEDDAMRACRDSSNETSCVLAMANGTLREGSLDKIAGSVGSRNVEAVRVFLVRQMRTRLAAGN